MKKIVVIVCFIALQAFNKKETQTLDVNFQPKFGNQILKLDKTKYFSLKKDTLSISTFKFYVSNVQLELDDHQIYKELNSFHLIDAENPESLLFQLKNIPNKPIKKIIFNVGIDEKTNVSDNFTGDLNPSLGMYWAWNSGYINLKLDGKSNSCISLKKDFQFHIGGYLPMQNALQTVELELKNQDKTAINVDVSQWLNAISLKETPSIMIPGEKAIVMSGLYKNMFFIDEK